MRQDLLRLRRGAGIVYLAAAVIHAGEMIFATLYSLGRLHVYVPAQLWKELYYAHFLFLILGGLIYLGLGFKQCGIFYYEVLADFLVGVAAFVVLLTAVASLLASGRINPWFSLTISAFLAAYGLGLIQGRVFGFGPKLPPLL